MTKTPRFNVESEFWDAVEEAWKANNPALEFINDSDTGMFMTGLDKLGIQTPQAAPAYSFGPGLTQAPPLTFSAGTAQLPSTTFHTPGDDDEDD